MLRRIFCTVFSPCFRLSTESKSDRSKISVNPVPGSDQRKSTFYRRSNKSSSDCETSATFHCDVSALISSSSSSTSTAGEFMFSFPTDCTDDRPDSDITSRTGNGTTSRTDSATASVMQSSTSAADGKDLLASAGGCKSTSFNTLCFSSLSEGTPFRFNFDAS